MSHRLKFFMTHLLFSLSVALLSICIVFLVWYPLPLAKATGVTHIFLILLTIDIIIGPILGYIVYKENKKSLKFDLTVIILIQISAFMYGLYSVAQGRPIWLVYSVDRVQVIRSNEIALQKNKVVSLEYQKESWIGPKLVAVKLSKNKQERESDMFNAVFGLTLAKQPNRYVKFSEAKTDVLQNAENLNKLIEFNLKNDVEKILKKYPEADSWVPLKANAVNMVVLMNRQNAKVIKIVDLRPWKE